MPPLQPPAEAPTLPLEPVGGAKRAPQVEASHPIAARIGSILVSRYRLTDLLGEGGMSRVFKAVDEVSSPGDTGSAPSVIAIKVLSQNFTDPAGRFAALTGHVNRLRRLVHPNIVNLYGCERDGAIAFITMEHLPGDSTYSMLHPRAGGSPVPLEAQLARRIVAMVANALKYAHSQSVVHGDLKPGNVMVGPDYGAKVIDFGMTRWRTRSGTGETVAAYSPAATAQYASPQVMAGEEPHPSDDVFGLACLAYEILTGVHPFDGEETTRSAQSTPPHRPGLTPSEYAALLHALQFERQQRTSSVRDFMAEFAAPSPRPSSLRSPLYTLAAAVVVAAGAGIFWWTQYKGPPPLPEAVQPLQVHEPAEQTIQTPAAATATAPASAPQAPVREKAGAVIHDCPTCPAMTVLPSGEFQQGAPDGDRAATALERPQHLVRIEYPFAISTSDVTIDDFRRFAEAEARDMKGCDTYDGEWRHRASANWQEPGFAQTNRHPVVCVSWSDAVAYADWLSKTTGHKYRLPSASEWEYAARAGSAAERSWSLDRADACAVANVADRSAERRYPGWQVFPCDDGYVYSAPVGSFGSNDFALSDVIGNVLVWTQDCWVAGYTGAPNDGSARVSPDCLEHEVRGASWFSPPAVVKVSNRSHFQADYRTSSVGVRLVREMN